MIELNLTDKIAATQDNCGAIAGEIDAYSEEIIHDILTGEIEDRDAIDAIDSNADEAIDALHAEISSINRTRTLAVQRILAATY